MVNNTIAKPIIPTKPPLGYKCIYITPPVVKVKAEKEPTKVKDLDLPYEMDDVVMNI